MIFGQALRDFNELQSQYGGLTNNHLKLIQEGLLEYFLTINLISKKNLSIRRSTNKPQSMTFKRFAARLVEMNNFLPLFIGSDDLKKMKIKELNEILLHTVTNAWEKQSCLQGWDFELKTYRETCAMFERMEVSEQVYEEGTPYKTPRLRITEQELLLHTFGWTNYVQWYLDRHWGTSMNYSLNMVVWPITISSLFRRVY